MNDAEIRLKVDVDGKGASSTLNKIGGIGKKYGKSCVSRSGGSRNGTCWACRQISPNGWRFRATNWWY